MKARQIHALGNVPLPERYSLVAEGVAHLVAHIENLAGAAQEVRDRYPLQAAILDSAMAEEAAKVLILVDYWRAGTNDSKVLRRQLGWFYSHLARGIYVQAATISAGHFGELKGYVETLRASRYLDGPNDVDWVFRNVIESTREGLLYVDYVGDEEGFRWVTPANSYPLEWPARTALDLVRAMTHVGMLTEAGLRAVHRVWRGIEMNNDTHWPDHHRTVRELLFELDTQGVISTDTTDRDFEVLQDQWTFPMTSLDLRRREVSDAEIREQRERMEGNYYA
jgi:hypothetical protein